MLQSLVPILDACCQPAPYRMDHTPAWIDEYLNTSRIKAARDVLEKEAYSAHASAGLYADQRLERVERAGDWRSFLVKVPFITDAISTSVDNSFIYVISSPGPLKMVCFEVEGYPLGSDLPGSMSIRHIYDIDINQGDTFFIPAGSYATKVYGPVDQALFLRFSGKLESTYLVSFHSDTLGLRAISYGDNAVSGRQFFADLFREVVYSRSGLAGHGYSVDEMALIKYFLSNNMSDPALPISVQWRLCQVAAKVDPSSARQYLAALSTSGSPNAARQARRILGTMG